jgi:hypothetical protein
MQSGLSAGDKKWLWGTVIVTVLLAGGSGLATAPGENDPAPYPSSYSPKPDGAMAAYMLLDKLGYNVRRWESVPADLASLDSHSVLILAEPSVMALPQERTDITAFVKRGGRVLFCGHSLSAFFPLPDTSAVNYAPEDKYSPRVPSALSRDADSIRMPIKSVWKDPTERLNILYGSDKLPVVVASQIDKGEVIWWASAAPLTNAGLKDAQNLQLFLNVVSRPDGSPLPVYWDEYFHGQQGGLWSYVAKTPVPWGIWQLLLASLIALFTYSRRSGPIVPPAIRARLSPLEFVDTMGELYRRAGATDVAIDVPYKRLRLQLARRLSAPITTTDAALAQSAARRFGLPEDELRETLESASLASKVTKFDRKKALALVQSLLRFGRQLSGQRSPQENKA